MPRSPDSELRSCREPPRVQYRRSSVPEKGLTPVLCSRRSVRCSDRLGPVRPERRKTRPLWVCGRSLLHLFFLTRRSSVQYACMRCTPGELRRCLFWHQAAPYPNAIFVAFVRDSLSHDSRRFAFRLAAEPFGSALFFTQPCGLRCARSRRSSLFLRAAFFCGVRIGARPCFFGRRLHFFFRGALPRTISGAGLVQVRFLDVFAAVAVELPVRAGSLFFPGAFSG